VRHHINSIYLLQQWCRLEIHIVVWSPLDHQAKLAATANVCSYV